MFIQRRIFVCFIVLALVLFTSAAFAQLAIIDFDGSIGGEDYDLGWIEGLADANGYWMTNTLVEEAYYVITDPENPDNKLFSMGLEEPNAAGGVPWALYVMNDDSLLQEDVYLQVDVMFPDDSAFIAQGITLAGTFSNPLDNWGANQVLVVNDANVDVFNARDAGSYTHDVEVVPEMNVWYRYLIEANVPSRSYDWTITNLSTGESFAIATGYAFRGDTELQADEGLGVIAMWNQNSDQWYGLTYIDNIILSNEPIEVDVKDWMIQ